MNDDANTAVGGGLPSVNIFNDIMPQKMLLLRANCKIRRSWNLEEDLKWAMNNSYGGKGKYTLFKMRNTIINMRKNYWYKANSPCTPGIQLHYANLALFHQRKAPYNHLSVSDIKVPQWSLRHFFLQLAEAEWRGKQADTVRPCFWLLEWLLTVNKCNYSISDQTNPPWKH